MKDILIGGAKQLGIKLDENQLHAFMTYGALLKEWNEKMNLTAITDDEGIAVKHFLDSMSALCTGYVKGSVIDVGTGAGFPGMVLKIAKPEISLTLLDSLNKRLKFLGAVCDELHENDVQLVHARAEDAGKDRMLRGKFDTAVSRAVADMSTLSEWCLPFVKIGGYFLALKGPSSDDELKNAKRAISILGGEVEDVFETQIPYSDLKHRIIIVKKVRQTPMRFPRKPGIAAKNPIEQCYNLSK